MASYHQSEAFDEREKTCLRLADAMTATPALVSDELFAELKVFFTSAALVEVTGVIAWENFRARQNRALGIESDGFSEGARCPMPVRLENARATVGS